MAIGDAGIMQGTGGATSAASGAAGGSIMKSVPWLGLVNLFGSGVGAYFDYQAAKDAAKTEQERYDQQIARMEKLDDFEREKFETNIQMQEQARKDAFKQLAGAKIRYMMESQPKLRSNINKMRAVDNMRVAVNERQTQFATPQQAPVQVSETQTQVTAPEPVGIGGL